MFKKKNNSCDYKTSVTVPFEVCFEDENPKKMKKIKKEIKKQEKKDPNNPENIFCIIDKHKKKNQKKISSSTSMPCVKEEDDINPDSLSVKFGQDVIYMHNQLRMPLRDTETGEIIRPEFFTSYGEIANVTYQTGFLSSIDSETRNAFIRRVRNVDRNYNRN